MKKFRSTNAILAILILILLVSSITLIFVYRNKFEKENSTIILTVDSLITGSTITLVAFTNYASIKSGSSTIIRRTYWWSWKFSSNIGLSEKILVMISFAFIPPVFLLFSSISLTVLEFLLITFFRENLVAVVLLMFTFLILFSVLVRYLIFYRYSNQNAASFIARKYIKLFKYTRKNSSEFINGYELKSLNEAYDFITYIRASDNFTMFMDILKKIKSRLESVNNNCGALEFNGEFMDEVFDLNFRTLLRYYDSKMMKNIICNVTKKKLPEIFILLILSQIFSAVGSGINKDGKKAEYSWKYRAIEDFAIDSFKIPKQIISTFWKDETNQGEIHEFIRNN